MQTNLDILEFDLLSHYPHITACTFLRTGGVSTGPFSTMNLNNSVGDNPEHVKTNREIARSFLGVSKVIYPSQTHGDEVLIIDEKNIDKVPSCDALITKMNDVGLAITHADCQVAVFYDPNNEAIGAVHCGWRGSVKNIYAKTIDAMQHAFGTEPKSLIVGISASLGPCHSEFINHEKELPKEFLSFEEKKNHFNFWDISKKQLMDAGVLDKNIEIAKKCTFEDEKNFYSYRRENKTGRHATVIALKS